MIALPEKTTRVTRASHYLARWVAYGATVWAIAV
jgi:hypothetical protein